LVRRTEGRQGTQLPRAPGVAAWGSHGAGSPQVRHDAPAVHGDPAMHGARRMATRRRAHRQVQGKGTTQVRARLWFISRWVGDGVVAGLTMKAARCRHSRRRSTPCSARAPLHRGKRYSLPPLTRAASGLGALAMSRALASPSPHLLFFPRFPRPSPLTAAQDGENPNAARLREGPDAGEK
jgi:hypothetical protein